METLQKKIDAMKESIKDVDLLDKAQSNHENDVRGLMQAVKIIERHISQVKLLKLHYTKSAHNLRSEILTDIGHLPKQERDQYLEMLK